MLCMLISGTAFSDFLQRLYRAVAEHCRNLRAATTFQEFIEVCHTISILVLQIRSLSIEVNLVVIVKRN